MPLKDLEDDFVREAQQLSENGFCDDDELKRCLYDAREGVRLARKNDSHAEALLMLAEMKGEWSVRYEKTDNLTEQGMAARITYVLEDFIYGTE